MGRLRKYIYPLLAGVVLAIVAMACGSARHVPTGEYLLDKVRVTVADSSRDVRQAEMQAYVRQQPNHRMLWSARWALGIYNLSGKDTTKWINRFLRRIGEAPVIYDSALTAQGVAQLTRALGNKGYLSARVVADTVVDPVKRKISVNYLLYPGESHRIRTIQYAFPTDSLRELVMADSSHFTVRPGDNLDLTLLEEQREEITRHLRNKGFFAFNKDYITFNADTTAGSHSVDLTMTVRPPYEHPGSSRTLTDHREYFIRSIRVITDYNPSIDDDLSAIAAADTVLYKDLEIFYGNRRYLRPSVLYENCFLRVGAPYSEAAVNRTYQALSRLNILKFTNIRFVPAVADSRTGLLDVYILLTREKSQSVAFELEGTNSEGDLGVAAAVTYSHRNIGRGSETLTAKVRGAYESISGNLEGFIHNRYMEYSMDAAVNFPKFKAPFLKESFKRRVMATTELNMSVNYQERPEYTRIIATAGWGYRWMERRTRNRHTFTLVDVNYVYLPESTVNFLDQIAPDNPLLRYSYEDHFIMRMGYSFYHTNKRRDLPWTRSPQRNVYTLRVNAEIAGNLLFAFNSIINHRPNFHTDPYKIFGIRYSQYFKMEMDYGAFHTFDRRQSLAWHVGFGIGVPYGNSTILPFEKRFYGGGANGVRGWAVRTLGPGSFDGTNSVSNFINQCGDIRFDASVEYRAKLFWVVELGVFVDAGNIWTIHDYPNQPGGMFRFNSFYKQIAASYGAGIRLDFNYFLLRFDLGMKARNPARGADPWPLVDPQWKRDASFHFSIGYPF